MYQLYNHFRLVKCGDIVNELAMVEAELFGNIREDLEYSGTQKLRHRLSREEILDNVLVAKHEFMQVLIQSLSCSSETKGNVRFLDN